MELTNIMFAVWQCLVTAICLALVLTCNKVLRQINDAFAAIKDLARVVNERGETTQVDIDDLRNYIIEVEDGFRVKLGILNDKYEAAEEMMKQVRKAAEEAEATEKKMQDGISEILNYSGIEKVQDAFNFR